MMSRSRSKSHQNSERNLKSIQSANRTSQTRLYDIDYIKRYNQRQLLQHQYQQQINLLANTNKITPESYQYISQAIKKQIKNKLIQIASEGTIGFDQINILIRQFLGIKKSRQTEEREEQKQIKVLVGQIYLLVCKYRLNVQPNFNTIFQLFRLLLDPFNLSGPEMLSLLTQNPQFQNIEESRSNFIEENPGYKVKTIKIQQILLLFKKLKVKYEMFQKKNRKNVNVQTYSFRPTINQKSEELASKSINKYLNQNSNNVRISNSASRHQLLHNRKLQKNKVMPKMERDPECTFQPNHSIFSNHNNSRYFNSEEVVDRLYHVPIKSNRDLHKQQQDYQLKNCCTFEPRLISKSPQRNNSKNVYVRNYQKSVGRMASARSRKQQIKEAYQNLGKVKNKNSNAKPPSMAMKQPKIILEIKIDEFRVQKLKIFGNQNPRIVAKKFVLKNGLDDDMIEVVIDILNQYCSQYISCQSSQIAF